MDEREIESLIDEHFEGLGISKGEGPSQYLTKTIDFGVRVTYKKREPVIIWKKDADDDNSATAKRKLDGLTSN